MPLSIDFAAIAASFRAPFAVQTVTLRAAFERLGRWLDRRLDAARDLERRSREFPVVDFYNDSITASIDRAQRHGLAPAASSGFGQQIASGAQRFVAGVGQVPRGAAAGLAIPQLLRAIADLIRTLGNAEKSPNGATQLERLAERMKNWTESGSSGLFDGLIAFGPRLPRLAAAAAVIVSSLSQFITALGANGAAGLNTFAGGAEALSNIMPQIAAIFASKDTQGGDSGPKLTPAQKLHVATKYLALALLGVPWLGLYLKALIPKAALGLKLIALDMFEGIERKAWDLRASVVTLFASDLVRYQRVAVEWLDAISAFVLSQLTFYLSFAELYLSGLFVSLRQWGTTIGTLLDKVTTIIQWIQRIMTALFDYNLLALLLPVNVGLSLRFGSLVEAAIEGAGHAVEAVTRVLEAAEAVAPASIADKIRGLRQLIHLPAPLQPLPPDTPPPRIAPFPNLAETLFGRGGRGLREAVAGAFGTTQNLVRDVVESGRFGMADAARSFAALRDQAARSDVSARFRDVVEQARTQAGEQMLAGQMQGPAEASGLEGVAASWEAAMAAGGFAVVGAVIPMYIGALREYWERERPQAVERQASPHILARRARLTAVRLPRLTIRVPGRALDDALTRDVAGRFSAAVSAAFNTGLAQLSSAAAAAR